MSRLQIAHIGSSGVWIFFVCRSILYASPPPTLPHYLPDFPEKHPSRKLLTLPSGTSYFSRFLLISAFRHFFSRFFMSISILVSSGAPIRRSIPRREIVSSLPASGPPSSPCDDGKFLFSWPSCLPPTNSSFFFSRAPSFF